MADFRNKKIRRGKIEFWRNDVICSTPLSIVFKGIFEGRIDVAVKRIPLNLAKLAENEIDVLLGKTDHDNVVKYYSKEQDRDFCYIAMQLCPCNLEQYVEKKGNFLRHGLELPNTPVEEILQGAAEGLSHIHKKDIIHRDIKPSNILLSVKKNKLVAKISYFGLSRFIPDNHSIAANFSAGTDLYKAPEVRTPQFSWRSDVYAFGLVVFYVLSKGKHLLGNNLSQIINGNPVNLEELNGQPAALSLVKWLTAFNQEERPMMSEVVHHPFFWDDKKKLNFIRDVHQVIQDRQNAFLKEVIEENSHHVICSSPKNCGNQRNPPDPAACADWTYSLAPLVKADCRGKVNTKSCADLVRIIRNKFAHFYYLKRTVKAEYGGNIEGFRQYWLERFPSLVIHLWEKVELTHIAAHLSGYYFAPESVRRRNVETTLIRTIDEGGLGDPQELLDKVKRMGSSRKWEDAIHSAIVNGRREHLEVLLKEVTGRSTLAERQQRRQQQQPTVSPPIAEFTSDFLKDFEPVRLLGSGGFGLVFEARKRLDNCPYAVKRIRSSNSDKALEKDLREVLALAKLDHPHIVRYYDAWLESPPPGWQKHRDQEFKLAFEGKQSSKVNNTVEWFPTDSGDATSQSSAQSSVATLQGNDIKENRLQQPTVYKSEMYLYIQMQLCEEESLRNWLETNLTDRDSFEVVRMFSEIVQAVEYVHSQRFIHRDLKPSNIFFALDGKIKIGDFGLATAMTEDPGSSPSLENPEGTSAYTPLYRHTDDVGTELYMSPEQIERKPYDQKVDIYALGLIFFELLWPFSTQMERVKTVSQLKESLKFPQGFSEKHKQEHELLKKMLSPNPNERPTASEVLRSPPLADYQHELLTKMLSTIRPDYQDDRSTTLRST